MPAIKQSWNLLVAAPASAFNFLSQYWMDQEMQAGQRKVLTFDEDEDTRKINRFVDYALQQIEQQPDWAAQHSISINQLLYCEKSLTVQVNAESICEDLKKLRENYLRTLPDTLKKQFEAASPAIQDLSTFFLIIEQLPDWVAQHSASVNQLLYCEKSLTARADAKSICEDLKKLREKYLHTFPDTLKKQFEAAALNIQDLSTFFLMIEQQPAWAAQHSISINQLLYCEKSLIARADAESTCEDLKKLREKYLHTFPETLKKQFKKFHLNITDLRNFFLISKDKTSAIAFDHKFYEANILRTGDQWLWSNAYYFVQNGDDYDYSPQSSLFTQVAPFPLLKQHFLKDKPNKEFFKRFLVTLPWKSDDKNFDYLTHFQKALDVFSYNTKLVAIKHTDNLNGVFKALYVKPDGYDDAYISHRYIEITEDHLATIISCFTPLLGSSLKSDHFIQAHFLLNLASIFVRYSSNFVFGTERDSPQQLRWYALALLNKSYQLNEKQRWALPDIEDWRTELFGINRFGINKSSNGKPILGCTAILYEDIKNRVILQEKNNPGLQGIYGKIVPLTWQWE